MNENNGDYVVSPIVKFLRIALIQIAGFASALGAFKLSDSMLITLAKVSLVLIGTGLLIWGYFLLRKFNRELKTNNED